MASILFFHAKFSDVLLHLKWAKIINDYMFDV